MLLTIDGHTVHIVNDGPTALEALRTFQPNAVLLDLGLPGMSGYELARTIRKKPDAKNLLIVALSGYAREVDRRRSIEAAAMIIS